MVTISNVLEHWATIYKPLHHDPNSAKLEDQSFFRIRYIDLENVFSRNANVIHSPCMLQSVISTGELKSGSSAVVSHQIWFLAKVKDTPQTLGRYDGNQIEQTANDLMDYCKDLVAWLLKVKRTGECPVTHRSFADEPVVMQELQSIDVESISFGVLGEIYQGKWLVAGLDWKALQPLYKFGCNDNGKYIVPQDDTDSDNTDAPSGDAADNTDKK